MQLLCEWGKSGMEALLPQADVLVIVDVLSFSTCVDIACARGASVIPFPIQDRQAAQDEAVRLDALLAGKRSDPEVAFSLSAPTLQAIPTGTRLILPSPNGSRISHAAKGKPVLAGCLRNAVSAARAAAQIADGGTVAVIPAGELWPDGSLRPAIEDLLGAGAILSELSGRFSPEARIVRDAYLSAVPSLREVIFDSVSGRELHEKGFPQDVEIAVDLNVSESVPFLQDGEYRTYTE